MLESLNIISGGLKRLYLVSFMNMVHLLLNGAPYGILFLVLEELFSPKKDINAEKLAWMFGSMVMILLANMVLAVKVYTRAYTTAFNLCSETRLSLGSHLKSLSMGFFKRKDPGDITSLLLQDMTKVEMVFSHFFKDALSCAVIPALMALFFFFLEIKMTALMLVSLAVAIPSLLAGQKIIVYFGRQHLQTRNDVASRILEYLQGIKTLKSFNLTGKAFTRLDKTLKAFRDLGIKLEAAAAGPIIIYLMILELGFISLLLLGIHLLIHNEIDVSVLLTFLVLGYKFFEPLLNFGVYVSEMRYMTMAAGRIANVMAENPLPEPDHPKVPKKYDIEFKDVGFRYDKKEVLKSVNAVFPEKSITALVGRSGSGKTTMTNLISRFWDVESGSISIGGIDVREIQAKDLYACISTIFQEVYLFQDTIFNNIRVGKKNAGRQEVIDTAKMAQCHDFIQGLPNGYDTMVGEGGSTLSGGEKQRISIARAMLKDAPIIILDEATASLDPENELLIQKAIGKLVRSKTLIVIAHRLNTVRDADKILVLDQGQVAEKGTHSQLLANGGLYESLWQQQQKSGGWKFSPDRNINKISA